MLLKLVIMPTHVVYVNFNCNCTTPAFGDKPGRLLKVYSYQRFDKHYSYRLQGKYLWKAH